MPSRHAARRERPVPDRVKPPVSITRPRIPHVLFRCCRSAIHDRVAHLDHELPGRAGPSGHENHRSYPIVVSRKIPPDVDNPAGPRRVTVTGSRTPARSALHSIMSSEPARDEVDRMPGPVVLEFGASWCGVCQRARPLIDQALAQALDEQPELRRIWIEDGRDKRLGRSFGIKLWPTLVVLRDGREVARVVRPRDLDSIRAALSAARQIEIGAGTGPAAGARAAAAAAAAAADGSAESRAGPAAVAALRRPA